MNANDRIFVTIFLGIFIEAMPFLLAGVLVSSAIHLFLTPERLHRLLPAGALPAALVGTLLGLVFPVCECGSVPAARSLLEKGAPPALGIAFVLAAPVVNPIVIASTAVAFAPVLGWGFVAWRVGLTLTVAISVALLLSWQSGKSVLLAPAGPSAPGWSQVEACGISPIAADAQRPGQPAGPAAITGRIRQFLSFAGDEFFEMSRYLVFGAFVAAALQSTLPTRLLLVLGHGPVLPMLVLMGLAVVLSICSTVDAFVALSLVSSFAPAALLAFLVFGPMIDLKSTLMFTTTFRRPVVAGMVALTFLLVLGLTVTLNLKV